MLTVHLHVPAAPEPCGYLPGREAATEYRLMTGVTREHLEFLIERGWRRFGVSYFRPVCAGCFECVSLRIPIAGFSPSKSQRRALRKCAHLRVECRDPVADEERLTLHERWYAMREDTRNWTRSRSTLEEFAATFCVPHPSARELDYYDGDRLIAVGFVDETPNALSSVYFFYDPDYRHLSLGIASVLFEMNFARDRGCSHLYLGYRVAECPSSSYKARFGPHELLVGRPEISERPVWRPA